MWRRDRSNGQSPPFRQPQPRRTMAAEHNLDSTAKRVRTTVCAVGIGNGAKADALPVWHRPSRTRVRERASRDRVSDPAAALCCGPRGQRGKRAAVTAKAALTLGASCSTLAASAGQDCPWAAGRTVAQGSRPREGRSLRRLLVTAAQPGKVVRAHEQEPGLVSAGRARA